ncbi:hypothetical protein NBE99_02785 [Thermosynechococcus sp. HN-54]|uniref:hypothetical protein n=1 Tax=Thermosynechococcus sp. HN-54 TaxID=2933959 RepID=UPI00202D0913|nr:hypothetical protein [Thermosynechococcus sp. HN-54]URR36075.1 hypothetical protein NBE99_02785 [Thermosynechococcus sp. HN-54]
MQQVLEWAQQTDVKDVDHEFYRTVEGAHGRMEMRRYGLLRAAERLVDGHLWLNLRRVGVVESERTSGHLCEGGC